MSKLNAITVASSALGDLKCQLALFDGLHVLELDDYLQAPLQLPDYDDLVNAYLELKDHGIVQNVHAFGVAVEEKVLIDPNEETDIADLFPARNDDWYKFVDLIQNAETALLRRSTLTWVDERYDDIRTRDPGRDLRQAQACQLRAHAHKSKVLGRGELVVLPPYGDHRCLPYSTGSDNVALVTIHAVPSLPDNISISDILAFKAEPESKRFWLRLRNWQRRITQEGTTIQEAEDMLESSLSEYRAFMTSVEKRLRLMELQTLTAISLGLFEKTLRGKPSEAVSQFFKLKTDKLALLASESNAPGKELAYMYKLGQLR
jgi:hypothetical protein